jgi:hypothetical protein
MPLTDHVALVSLSSDVPDREVMRVAAALQKQVTRDFAPIWGVQATIDPFADLHSVPSDYHPVIVFSGTADLAEQLEGLVGEQYASRLIDAFTTDQLQGIHLNGFTRQPFALVEASEVWSVTASHEALEMIADPYGNRLVAASHKLDRALRVNYLLEVCDPCLAVWYPVNGLPVSDFYTPSYFDPVRTDGTRYSFTGEVVEPLEILPGGYLTWVDPRSGSLYQLQAGETEPVHLADEEALQRSSVPLRILVDEAPLTPQVVPDVLRPARSAEAAAGVLGGVRDAAEGAARRTVEAVISVASGRG